MKRASESSGAGSSAAQRPRVDRPAGSSSHPSSSLGKSGDEAAHVGLEGLGDVLDVVVSTTRQVKQYHASLAPRPGVEQETEALASSANVLKFLETRRAGRHSVQALIDELHRFKSKTLQNFEAEITVLNINGAPLLNKKMFSLPDHGRSLEHDGYNPTVQSVLDAIWKRVDEIVAQCRNEESAVPTEGQAYERAFSRAVDEAVPHGLGYSPQESPRARRRLPRRRCSSAG